MRKTTEKNNSTEFKFGRSVKVGAGNSLTVWSSTVMNPKQEPKTRPIVMNTQTWTVDKIMTTMLLNTLGEVCSLIYKFYLLS